MKLLLLVYISCFMFTRSLQLTNSIWRKRSNYLAHDRKNGFTLCMLKNRGACRYSHAPRRIRLSLTAQENSSVPNQKQKRYKPKIIFVLGGPGAGKGTQCAMLSNEFGIKHLSAGELLREERKNTESEYGKLIDSFLKEGKIVPVEISLGLLKKAIESCNSNRYLIDGFPRNFDNVEGWNRLMTEVSDIEKVLFIECDEMELERRLLNRGQSSGRNDDNLNTARKRFATFRESTLPVVEYYSDFTQDSNRLLKTVNGSQSVNAVYSELRKTVVGCIQREIVSLTKDIYRNIDSSSNYVVDPADVNMLDGKTAVITYDIVERDGFGNITNRKSCIDKWLLSSVGWNREGVQTS